MPDATRDRKTLPITLTQHQARLVEAAVQSGRFASPSDVVRDALRMLEDQLELHEALLEGARATGGSGHDALDGLARFDEWPGDLDRFEARERPEPEEPSCA